MRGTLAGAIGLLVALLVAESAKLLGLDHVPAAFLGIGTFAFIAGASLP